MELYCGVAFKSSGETFLCCDGRKYIGHREEKVPLMISNGFLQAFHGALSHPGDEKKYIPTISILEAILDIRIPGKSFADLFIGPADPLEEVKGLHAAITELANNGKDANLPAEGEMYVRRAFEKSSCIPVFEEKRVLHASDNLLDLAWIEVWNAFTIGLQRIRICPYCGGIYQYHPRIPGTTNCGKRECKKAHLIEIHGGIAGHRAWERDNKRKQVAKRKAEMEARENAK